MSKGKIPIYFFVAIIFLSIAKLLQVTVFDAEKYKKSKQSSFSSSSKESVKATKPKKNTSEVSIDSAASASIGNAGFTSVIDTNSFEEKAEIVEEAKPIKIKNEGRAYRDLEELKNLYLAPILASLPSGQLREDVVLRYYKHELDGDKVYALRNLGYYIHEKEADETAGMGSNVIYYGNKVAVEDIQIVAYMLLSNGIPLKSIEPTIFTWKANAIEIGTDPDIVSNADLTENDIRNFEK